MNALMAECKVTIPEITKKLRAVKDDDTDLKEIMDKAQKERKNSAKVPQLKVKSVQKKTDDGQVVTVQKYSECSIYISLTSFDLNVIALGKKCIFSVLFIGNPYISLLPDDIVEYNYKEYSGEWDKVASDCGFPDKFVYETVKAYLWRYRFILGPVSIIVI